MKESMPQRTVSKTNKLPSPLPERSAGRGGGSMNGIPLGGLEPDDVTPMLLRYFEIGKEFRCGATSLRQIAKSFEARSLSGDLPAYLPETLSSLSRACDSAANYFAWRFDVAAPAPLFVCRGTGWPFTGLTPLGQQAWEFARDLLLMQRIINERDCPT
jgi:hypothetical protein